METLIVITSGFVFTGIGWLACAIAYQPRLRRMEIEIWRAARRFYKH